MIKILLAFALLIVVVLSSAFYQKLSFPTAVIGNHEFQVLIVKTEEDKQIGLSKYTKLDENKSMLFIFEKPNYYRFWMKDMKFPIDIIFIKGNKIINIYKNAPIQKQLKDNLTTYSPTETIDKVLEINADLSEKFGFKAGDKVLFKNIK